MGRFYKTSAATYVDDKMFQLPADLMYNTLVKKDAAIDKVIDDVSEVRKSARIKNLDTDDPQVNARLSQYESQMNDITNAIYDKPLDFKRQQGNLKRFSSDLDVDLQRGMLSKAQANDTAYTDYTTSTKARKDVTEEKKQLATRLTKRRYAESGGLNYGDDGNYSNITDYEIALHADVDTGKMVDSIGTNFKPDKTSSASSNPTGTGYIRDKSENAEFISEDEVEAVVLSRLEQSGWEDERKQYYGMLNEVNDRNDDIDALLAQERASIVDQARTKIGYNKKTVATNLKGDPVELQNRSIAARKQNIKDGVPIYENIDPRNTTQENGARYKKTGGQVEKMKGRLLLEGSPLSFSDPRDLANKIANKEISMKDLNIELEKSGIDPREFRGYINDETKVENWITPTPTEGGPVNKTYLASTVQTFNSRNPNTPVTVRVSGSDGIYEVSPHKNVSQLVEDTKGDWVYVAQKKGVGLESGYKTNALGEFIDSFGDVIEDEDGNTATTLDEAKSLPTYDTSAILEDDKKTTTSATDKAVFAATPTNITQRYNIKFGEQNQISRKKELRVSKPYYRARKDPKTGKAIPDTYEAVNVEVIYNP